jgi:Tol biopolymer transport system component
MIEPKQAAGFNRPARYNRPAHMTGQTLGSYRVDEKIGEGGMGVVYRGHDIKLGRDVAIKVLSPSFAQDAERLARFEREARTLAALNHPNIATVYSVEQGALVMELVGGPTLAERLKSGPIPKEEAIEIARQIAAGLEAAHEKGITHRDLKPANIKLTPEGRVKLLDFGLAKAIEGRGEPTGSNPDNSPTLTAAMSGVGVILGTAGYMSPEQTRGETVDERTDIWAFGVVLYEMLTGKRLFTGDTVSDTLASVLKGELDWPALPADTPPWVRRLLSRCLERDKRKRLRDIGDAFIEETAPAIEARSKVPRWAIATAMLAAGLVIGWFARTPSKPEPPLRAFSFTPNALANVEYWRRAVISPNGEHVAYVAENKLWIRDLATEEARVLQGTENAAGPFWSPDSGQIGFAAAGELKKTSLAGDRPAMLVKLTSDYRGGAWSPDGRTILVSIVNAGLVEVPSDGGTLKTVAGAEASAFYSPQYLPTSDGSRVAVAAKGDRSGQMLELIDLTTGRTQTLREGAYPAWSASGHILFQTTTQASGLWALPFSLTTHKAEGEAFPVLSTGSDFSASADGTLLWADAAAGMSRKIVWRDRAGKKLGEVGSPQDLIYSLKLSPDGTKAAYSAIEQGNLDIWIVDLERSVRTRFTFASEYEGGPRWTPSGKEIVFTSRRKDASGIVIQPADGSGEPRTVVPDAPRQTAGLWTPDESTMLLNRWDAKTGYDLWTIRRKPDGTFEPPTPLLQSSVDERFGAFSPDGRYILYSSNQSRRMEVYVQSFPEGGSRQQISYGGGLYPLWRRDGREIFYIGPEDAVIAVPVSGAGASMKFGAGVELFRIPGVDSTIWPYDVSPDGQRFLLAEPAVNDKPPAIHVIQNWTKLLKQRPVAE